MFFFNTHMGLFYVYVLCFFTGLYLSKGLFLQEGIVNSVK